MAAKHSASHKKRLNTLAAQTTEKKQKLLECLTTMPTIESACRKADVGRATYYEWIADYKFQQAAVRAKAKGRELLCDIAISQLMRLVGEGNITAIIFYLKHNHQWFAPPKQFFEMQIIEDKGLDEKQKAMIHQTIERYVTKVAQMGHGDRLAHPEKYKRGNSGN